MKIYVDASIDDLNKISAYDSIAKVIKSNAKDTDKYAYVTNLVMTLDKILDKEQ